MSMDTDKSGRVAEMLARLERTNARLACPSGTSTSPLPLLIRHSARLLLDQANEDLRESGLNFNSFNVLLMIYSAPDSGAGINPSVLSDCAAETRTNMTRIIDDLVTRGLVQRVHCKEDRRRIDLHLTADGIGIVERALPIIRRHSQVTFDVFSEAERTELERLLIKLLSSAERCPD
ncbi:MAG: MarR family transcriptional regulator [Rhodocyclaceae bacterium]